MVTPTILFYFTFCKIKLENEYLTKKEYQQKDIEDLKRELERKADTHKRLSAAVTDLKAANDQLQVNWTKRKETQMGLYSLR